MCPWNTDAPVDSQMNKCRVTNSFIQQLNKITFFSDFQYHTVLIVSRKFVFKRILYTTFEKYIMWLKQNGFSSSDSLSVTVIQIATQSFKTAVLNVKKNPGHFVLNLNKRAMMALDRSPDFSFHYSNISPAPW